jgi:hypothetical protein
MSGNAGVCPNYQIGVCVANNSESYKGYLIERLGFQHRYTEDDGSSTVAKTPHREHYRVSHEDSSGFLTLVSTEFSSLEHAKRYVDSKAGEESADK